jgi:1-acyl-sn-glycerol-3-phosphate acyltransferase
MKTARQTKLAPGQPQVSVGVLKVFAAYSRGYVRRHFHAIRILKSGLPPRDLASPLVIYLNHASWWDPLVCLLLSREFFPSRTSFAPIDAAMLERYRFFRHLGFFPVEQRSTHGARQFLRATHAVLASPDNAVWLTPQGRFMDVRERPLRLQNGLGALATREPSAAFIPLAIEYAFWAEPRPEILVSFGEPIVPASEPARNAADWTRVFGDALEFTQDELAARSCRRGAAEWSTLDRGKSGVNGIYDAWRWLCARVRGQTFVPEHQSEATR